VATPRIIGGITTLRLLYTTKTQRDLLFDLCRRSLTYTDCQDDIRGAYWSVDVAIVLHAATLTPTTVLDGGTGFLKAGYAGQVQLSSRTTHERLHGY